MTRIVADLDLCQGHAECELAAPGVFRVSHSVEVLRPSAEPDEAVKAAIRNCPTQALRLEERQ